MLNVKLVKSINLEGHIVEFKMKPEDQFGHRLHSLILEMLMPYKDKNFIQKYKQRLVVQKLEQQNIVDVF